MHFPLISSTVITFLSPFACSCSFLLCLISSRMSFLTYCSSLSSSSSSDDDVSSPSSWLSRDCLRSSSYFKRSARMFFDASSRGMVRENSLTFDLFLVKCAWRGKEGTTGLGTEDQSKVWVWAIGRGRGC
jgi:hypothetical protein